MIGRARNYILALGILTVLQPQPVRGQSYEAHVPRYRGKAKITVVAACFFDDYQGKGRTVTLEYLTLVNIRDAAALSKEVDGIWATFQKEADSLDARRAMISPRDRSSGLSKPILFEKASTGTWTIVLGQAPKE